MANQSFAQVAYGATAPGLLAQAPIPIIANRIPTAADTGYVLGQLWVAKNVSTAYILTKVSSMLATWVLLSVGNPIATITSTGQFLLDTTAAAANVLGNKTSTTSITSNVGTGGYIVDGVGSSAYTFGLSTTTGTITIGGTAQTGNIILGSSTGVQTVIVGAGSTGAKTVTISDGTAGNTVGINTGANTVAAVTNINSGAVAADSDFNVLGGTGTAGTSTANINHGIGAITRVTNIGTGAAVVNTVNIGGTGANDINLGDTQTGGRVDIGTSMTTGLITIGGTGAATGTMVIGSGSGAQTLNMMVGTTSAKTINIGTGATNNQITIGSLSSTSMVTILGGTGGVLLSAAGNVRIAPGTVSAAAYGATLNAYVGQATLTGQVLASAGVQDLTITNSLAATTSPILVTVDNLGTNDAQLQIQRIKLATGSFAVTVKNQGAAALNGDIHVTWQILA